MFFRKQARPSAHKADLLGRVALPVGESLGIAVERDGGKCLMVKFPRPIEPPGKTPGVGGSPIGADIKFRDRRVVILQRRSVLAAIAEAAAAYENASAFAEVS